MNQWWKLRNLNAGSNLVDAGRCAVHGCPIGMVDSEPTTAIGGEAALKVCGVGVAMLPE